MNSMKPNIWNMYTMASYTLLIVFSVFICTRALEYKLLEETGVACPSRDSCDDMGPVPFKDRNCECDEHCKSFNDCCIDANIVPRWSSHRQDCMPFNRSHVGAYAIGGCPRTYNGPVEIRHRCLNTDIRDPLAAAPVTDMAHSITYRNRYCAECNGAANLVSWLITLDCNNCESVFNKSFILQHIRFNSDFHRWEVLNGDELLIFDVVFNKPSYVMARRCRPGLISNCPNNYANQTTRRLCESYTAATKFESSLYKNPHCAMCNNAGRSIEDAICFDGMRIISRKKPFSFALLLDVNQSSGDKVGVANKCPADQKFDPFFKKCRTLVCAIPGYVKEGKKCVKKKEGS